MQPHECNRKYHAWAWQSERRYTAPTLSHRFFPVMRFLFLLLVLANLGVAAYGEGLFGPPPSEEGRQSRRLTERQQHTIAIGTPLPATQAR
ncbi:hypothetical protein GSY71_12585 [Pusillimonas sp. TS35]|nr:hypothetical protein [Pusillimonas sp. TS35]